MGRLASSGGLGGEPGHLRAVPPTIPVAVDVTFLRMDRAPSAPIPAWPIDTRLERVARCTPAFYRYLYGTVGRDYVWWLRRTMGEAELAATLADPALSIHVLYQAGAPAGFFELDRRTTPITNLAYFGLMPHAVGRGLGKLMLRHAVRIAWDEGCMALTVNTCTADHPRALPNYVDAGFSVLRRVREIWPVPASLNLPIPAHLRLR